MTPAAAAVLTRTHLGEHYAITHLIRKVDTWAVLIPIYDYSEIKEDHEVCLIGAKKKSCYYIIELNPVALDH